MVPERNPKNPQITESKTPAGKLQPKQRRQEVLSSYHPLTVHIELSAASPHCTSIVKMMASLGKQIEQSQLRQESKR